MGTRQACEQVARTAFKKGFSVIVDRVNFDIKQRNNWVKLASEFYVNNIRYGGAHVTWHRRSSHLL